MGLFSFTRQATINHAKKPSPIALECLLNGYSIEVTPRTADVVESFRDILPVGTRVYIAHIEGTPIYDMVRTAHRLSEEGFAVMPHFPARLIKDKAELIEWISQYQGEAGIEQGLILGGGLKNSTGNFKDSMQLIETGLFDNFKHLHFAGHPEGNDDIESDGSDNMLMQALRLKQNFSERTDANVAIITQFCFESAPIISWAEKLAIEGIQLPIHIGLAGPAKLHTLIKYAISCGVGPSMKVLQRRAKDMSKLLVSYEPTELLAELAFHKEQYPSFGIEQVHLFPLGGIKSSVAWATANGVGSGKPDS